MTADGTHTQVYTVINDINSLQNKKHLQKLQKKECFMKDKVHLVVKLIKKMILFFEGITSKIVQTQTQQHKICSDEYVCMRIGNFHGFIFSLQTRQKLPSNIQVEKINQGFVFMQIDPAFVFVPPVSSRPHEPFVTAVFTELQTL